MDEIVIVVTGDAPLDHRVAAAVPAGAIVIAADGALDHALAAGLAPAALVGDLDSVSATGLAWAEEHATVDRHPPDKEHTDTELALATAAALNPARVVLVSGGGDRLDHTFAAIGALGHPWLTSVPALEGWWGQHRLVVLHGPGRTELRVGIGTTISLLALHGRCQGVTLDGVRWPLVDDDLEPLVGRGVSNETTDDTVDVSVTSGVLTIVVDDALALGESTPTDHPPETR